MKPVYSSQSSVGSSQSSEFSHFKYESCLFESSARRSLCQRPTPNCELKTLGWRLKTGALSFLFLALTALACKEPVDKPTPIEEIPKEILPVDRGEVFANIFDNIVIKHYQAFNAEADFFAEKVEEFHENSTSDGLVLLQSRWKVLKIVWESGEVFDIGDIADNFLHNRIDKYPTNVRFIEKNLTKGKTLDNDFVNISGSTTVGLPVLEYLLFKGTSQEEILGHFTSDTNSQQYLTYVLSLSQNLAEKSGELLTEITKERTTWVGNQEEYTLSELVNSQITIIEEIKGSKLNKPLGSAKGGVPDPEMVETPYAKVSFKAIALNLYSIGFSFEGDTTKPNMYDLLNYIQRDEDIKLAETIQKALETSINTVNSFSNPLKEEVENNTDAVEALSEEVRVLLVAIKVDLANLLGVTVVFNDNDGD